MPAIAGCNRSTEAAIAAGATVWSPHCTRCESVLGQQQRRRHGATARGGDRDAGVARYLTLIAFTAQLQHRLVGESEAVQTPPAQLAAAGVHGQFAIKRNATTAIEEFAAFAHLAEAESFKPGDRQERKAVVELDEI